MQLPLYLPVTQIHEQNTTYYYFFVGIAPMHHPVIGGVMLNRSSTIKAERVTHNDGRVIIPGAWCRTGHLE